MFSATHSLKGLSCLNSPGTPQRHSADLRRQPNFAEKSVIAAISCVEQRSFKIPQLPALREVVSESAQQKRRFSPAFFRPPVHFQKHGNPPTEVGPIVVGKPHVILPFDEKGQCRREVSRLFATLARQGPKAVVCGQRMPPRPRPPDTAAHRGKRGRNCWGLNDREKRLLCRRRRNSRI